MSRTRCAATLLGLLLLGGCGADSGRADSGRADSGRADSEQVSTPAATATTTTTATPDEPLPCVPGVEVVPGAAQVGPERAMAAYCLLVDLALEHGFTRLVLPGEADGPQDLAAVRPALTEAARGRWDDAVEEWLEARDPRAGALLDGLMLHDVTRIPAGYRINPDGAYAYGTSPGPPTARVLRGGEALEIRFAVQTGLVLERKGDASGRHSLLPVTRDATYVLLARGEDWQLDRWRTTLDFGEVRLVGGG